VRTSWAKAASAVSTTPRVGPAGLRRGLLAARFGAAFFTGFLTGGRFPLRDVFDFSRRRVERGFVAI
jgi:hypothetical protein